MEELSYSKLQNFDIIQQGAGVLGMLSGASMTASIPIIFSVLGTCMLSMYLCSNSNKVFKKSTEEFFVFLWVGLLLAGTLLAYLQVNDYLLALPPFVGPGIYIGLLVILVMSCCFSM